MPSRDLDVRARRVEVRVRRDDLARVDDRAEEDALGAAALVRRHDEREAEHLLDRRLEPREALRAGVGLVAEHHRRPLRVAHRAGAGVGQEIELDVARGELEDVPAGDLERALALLARRRADGLDHLDPKRFARGTHRRGRYCARGRVIRRGGSEGTSRMSCGTSKPRLGSSAGFSAAPFLRSLRRRCSPKPVAITVTRTVPASGR